MDITLKIFAILFAGLLFYMSWIFSKGIKNIKWNILITVILSFVGGIIVAGVYHNCNYGVCNI